MRDGAQTKRILLAGASGTIGSAVAETLRADGHDVVCLNRAHFADLETLTKAASDARPDTVISCIASRSGSPKDAEKVDCDANLALVQAAQAAGAEHLILLSAICVQKPRLAFQRAKIGAESAFKSSGIDWTIIHPTAFFKSLSGQIGRVKRGKPFLVFGNGELTRCKPISDRDLARYIADCVTDPARRSKTLPIGGPGPAISPNDQARMLSELLGREVKTRSVPLWMFTLFERVFALGAPLSDWCAAKAEYARIARYYATESMLVLDPKTGEYSEAATPEFGSDTLRDHYAQLIAEGGQE